MSANDPKRTSAAGSSLCGVAWPAVPCRRRTSGVGGSPFPRQARREASQTSVFRCFYDASQRIINQLSAHIILRGRDRLMSDERTIVKVVGVSLTVVFVGLMILGRYFLLAP